MREQKEKGEIFDLIMFEEEIKPSYLNCLFESTKTACATT